MPCLARASSISGLRPQVSQPPGGANFTLRPHHRRMSAQATYAYAEPLTARASSPPCSASAYCGLSLFQADPFSVERFRDVHVLLLLLLILPMSAGGSQKPYDMAFLLLLLPLHLSFELLRPETEARSQCPTHGSCPGCGSFEASSGIFSCGTWVISHALGGRPRTPGSAASKSPTSCRVTCYNGVSSLKEHRDRNMEEHL